MANLFRLGNSKTIALPFTDNMIKFFAIPSASGKIRLKIEKPATATGVMLRWKATAWASGDTKATGTLIATITDDIAYKGINQWYEVIGLTDGTAYYFKAFPYLDGAYNETIGVNETLCKAGGLYAEYTMDSVSGTVLYDTSGNAKNLTLVSPVYKSGTVGNCCTMELSPNTSPYQPIATVKGISGIFQQYSELYWLETGTNGRLSVGANSGKHFIMTADANITRKLFNATTPVSSKNNVYFKLPSADLAEDASIYIDGTLITYAVVSAASTNNGGFTRMVMVCTTPGAIDQLRFWGRDLESYEKTNLYNGGVGC